ncbi:uncharacterized protein EI90DRAFT_174575 [Cantharellus anzutake]|uniref:uncharacterized protein n=1 Tax=Cantharellus anzutake TaxID=1750568 RepID=UPI0019073497|nr:uncharacterized protein EI90DRAFT_174575 [Cantharellus anzutake]KAF8336432.1 hypothetical protein EI90DRAFT_174575 [Cantharellus anzutake]
MFITAPVVTTSCAAGQNCPLAWNDDGKPPTLSQIGACNVGLFVGSVSTQYLLQSISAAFDVSKAGTLNFSPDPSVGANSNQYFIRFTSNTLNSTTNTGYPYQAFSAKFTLTGMTGQFNSTVQQVMSASGPLTTALSTSGGVQSTVSGASITSSGNSSKVITSTTSIKGSSTSSPPPHQRLIVVLLSNSSQQLARQLPLLLWSALLLSSRSLASSRLSKLFLSIIRT